jgi:MFS family permease
VNDDSGLGRYAAVLRVPDLRRLFVAAFIGRLPVAMYTLAAILLVREATGSYAVAGAAVAGFSVGGGITAPIIGRLVDRIGQTPVLLFCAAAFPASVGALIAVTEAWPHTVPIVACSFATGVAFPPLFATLRTLITAIVGGTELVEVAFALEAVIQETFFIVGPLLVAVCVALGSPKLALAVAAVLVVWGTLAFAAAPASRRWRGGRTPGSRGALGSPGLRTLVVASVMDGMTFGTLEVVVPAFAQRNGSAGTAGVLLAMLAFGSMLGGLWYGSRRWKTEPADQILWFSVLLPVGLAPLALADSNLVMGALLALAGLSIAPAAAITFVLIGKLVPADAVTESFTWLSTGVIAGFALGGAAAGVIVETASVTAALVAMAGFALGGTCVIFSRRKTLRVTAAATSSPTARMPLRSP